MRKRTSLDDIVAKSEVSGILPVYRRHQAKYHQPRVTKYAQGRHLASASNAGAAQAEQVTAEWYYSRMLAR